MREKGEILSESSDGEAEAPKWQLASLYQERLKLEVLIDIRDELTTIKIAALALNEHFEGLI